jgi:cysteine synthase
LYRAERLDARSGEAQVWVKDDGQNPSASFKDRAGAVALAVARERGASVIAGATTGNAGSSMAGLAASVGMNCVIFLPESAPPAKIAQLLVFGAKVIAVRGTTTRPSTCACEVCRARGWFNRNTGSNPFTREGKKTCSFESVGAAGAPVPDWMVVCTGDGNIISGIWKGWRELKEMGLTTTVPKLVCAQSELSAAISHAVWKLQKKGGLPRWSDVTIEPVSGHHAGRFHFGGHPARRTGRGAGGDRVGRGGGDGAGSRPFWRPFRSWPAGRAFLLNRRPPHRGLVCVPSPLPARSSRGRRRCVWSAETD